MNITISGRKTTVKDQFKEKVEAKLSKFDRFFDTEANANVVVTNSHDRETVEVTISSNGMYFRSEKTTDDRSDSLEAVCDALFKQIVKNKNKLVSKVKSSGFENLNFEGITPEPEAAYTPIKTKKFPVKVMTMEEAILQMNMLGHEFFMFKNAESGEFNVVYLRNNGGYGLIEPIA